MLGSIVPIAIMYFGYHQVYLLVNPALLRSNYSLIAPNQFLLQVCGVMALIGIVIGSLGSIISMRRFLKSVERVIETDLLTSRSVFHLPTPLL